MRIIQLVQRPQRRGAEIFAHQLSRELKRQNHDVNSIYLYPFAGSCPLPLDREDVLLSGNEHHIFERSLGFHPQLLRRLCSALKRLRPDILQVNGARTVKYGAVAKHWLGNPGWKLIYRNIGNPQDWLNRWRHRVFYRRVVAPALDGVVGVSETTLSAVTQIYGLQVPTRRIPRGVDVDALRKQTRSVSVREELGAGPQTPVVVYLGSLTPEKRLDRLMRVCRQVSEQLPQLQLWVLGDGPLRHELVTEIQSHPQSPVVKLLGVQEEVGPYLRAADVLLLTSDTEGTPGVVLEAGAMETAVVATRVGGVHEVVRDGETGLLFDRVDEEGLKCGIIQLLTQSARRNALGAAGRKWVDEHFAVQPIAKRYLEFYRQILGASTQQTKVSS